MRRLLYKHQVLLRRGRVQNSRKVFLLLIGQEGKSWSALLLNRDPQFRVYLARCQSGAAAFLAGFGPFGLRMGRGRGQG